MRITFVIAVFPPEPEPSAVMAGELVREWSRAGHEVLVICPFPNRPGGSVYPGYRRHLWQFGEHEKGRVLHVWTWLIGSERRHVNRMLENVSFGLSSGLAMLLTRRPNAVLLETWATLAPLPVLAAAVVRRVPCLNYIKDIYPEAAVASGVIGEGSVLARLLRGLDRVVCGLASKNIVISEGMGKLIQRTRGVAENRVVVVHDWLDLTTIRRVTEGNTWRADVGLDEKEFLCMFAGTMGPASRVDVLLDVAKRLRDTRGIRLVCVGEGMLKKRMIREIDRQKLTNLTLLPFQPRERVSEMQSSADVMLFTSSAKMGVSSVPSKLVTYLAVGRPVICAAPPHSDIAELVSSHRLGKVIEPESAEQFADAILELRDWGDELRKEAGARAREVALNRYSLTRAVSDFEQLFRDVVADNSSGQLTVEGRARCV